MKKTIVSLVLATTFFSTSSFAAVDSYLQIKGTKGAAQVINCPNGVCTVPNLVADTYTVSVVDSQGKTVAIDSKYECGVTSPRDAASGLATGKRMHKPFVITKELNSTSFDVPQDETNLAITCVSNPVSPTTAELKAKTATYDLKEAKK